MNDWLTQSMTVNILIFVLCRLCRHQTTNKLVKHLLKKEEVLCKWLTEYLIEWFTLLRLCTSPQDIHVCPLSYRLTHSLTLPPAFVSSPPPTVSALLLSYWITSSVSLSPFVCHIDHPLWLTPHLLWCFHLPLKNMSWFSVVSLLLWR